MFARLTLESIFLEAISGGKKVGLRGDQTLANFVVNSKSRCKSIANEGGAKGLGLWRKRGLRMTTSEKNPHQSTEPPNS